jgi:hypothetical protein
MGMHWGLTKITNLFLPEAFWPGCKNERYQIGPPFQGVFLPLPYSLFPLISGATRQGKAVLHRFQQSILFFDIRGSN